MVCFRRAVGRKPVVLAFVWVMQRVFTKIENKKIKNSTVIADLLLLLLLLLLAPVSATTQLRQAN